VLFHAKQRIEEKKGLFLKEFSFVLERKKACSTRW